MRVCKGGQISEVGDKFPRKFGPPGAIFPRKFGPGGGGQIFGGAKFPVTPAGDRYVDLLIGVDWARVVFFTSRHPWGIRGSCCSFGSTRVDLHWFTGPWRYVSFQVTRCPNTVQQRQFQQWVL